MPINFKSSSPAQRENNHDYSGNNRCFSDSMCPCFALTIIGIDPTMSITAKATIPTVIISSNVEFHNLLVCLQKYKFSLVMDYVDFLFGT
jgi:hypothetical protein